MTQQRENKLYYYCRPEQLLFIAFSEIIVSLKVDCFGLLCVGRD